MTRKAVSHSPIDRGIIMETYDNSFISNCCGAGVLYLSPDIDDDGHVDGYTGMCASCHEWCGAEKAEEEEVASPDKNNLQLA